MDMNEELKHEIGRYTTVSTGHVMQSDMDILQQDDCSWVRNCVEYGVQVFVPSDLISMEHMEEFKKCGLSPALWTLLLKAREFDCNWVHLDRDGTVAESLPMFDW